jgi:4-amino-4-deoxy-L-arabinose transferase-like glycosyltransferase
VFGRNAWGARTPNAIFFALTSQAVAGIGTRLALWETLAILCFLHADQTEDRAAGRHLCHPDSP